LEQLTLVNAGGSRPGQCSNYAGSLLNAGVLRSVFK